MREAFAGETRISESRIIERAGEQRGAANDISPETVPPPTSALYTLLRPLLFSVDAERAHHLAHAAARCAQSFSPLLRLVSAYYRTEHPELKVSAFGVEFGNPFGIAAGFDKNGRIVDALGAIGFGFVEIGSVSSRPHRGNPQPRLFRLTKDLALINRMGLNNEGPEKILGILARQRLTIPFGMNVVKTNDATLNGDQAIADIVDCFARVAAAGSFVVLNLSCPNTEDGRPFEEPSALWLLLHAIFKKRAELELDIPVLVKFSPDLPEHDFQQSLVICEELGVAGYVLTNTSKSREGLATSRDDLARIGNGGLSGHPLFERTLARVASAYKVVGSTKPIIGCGGVFTGAEAYRLIRAGATLIEVYTGLVYQGPGFCRAASAELVRLLKRDGFGRIADAIGVDVD